MGCINLHLGICHSFTSLLLCYMSLDRGSLAICLELVASGLTVGSDLISRRFEIISFVLASQPNLGKNGHGVCMSAFFSSSDGEMTCKEPSLWK